jgi:hypothetical protein
MKSEKNHNLRDIYSNLLLDLKADSVSYSENLKGLKAVDVLHEQLYKAVVENDSSIVIERPNAYKVITRLQPKSQRK